MSAKRYFLKGIDYFQLLIDHHNKKKGGLGHEARLSVYLAGKLNEYLFLQILNANPHFQQLQTIRLGKSFGLGYPSITFTNTNGKIPVTFQELNGTEIPESAYNIQVQVYENPPMHIQVFYLANNTTCVLFTFHHILFDFAGVQSFINSLCGMQNIPLLPTETKPRKFSKRVKSFFEAVFFTFKEANAKMTVEKKPLPKQKPLRTTYKEITFTESERLRIYENASKHGLALNPGMYLLAGVSKGLHDEIFSKQKKHNFIWAPVPVNVRKKGTDDAILFNGLSFLFYKLRPVALKDIESTTKEIKAQMLDQMRKKLPAAFIDFADGYWYMPMFFYAPMMYLPSWGKLSSFSFSVLGNTFPNLIEFMGLKVTNIINHPSNSISPGITFLFYEFRGELRMMTSWVKGQYTSEEQDRVLDRVKNLLIE